MKVELIPIKAVDWLLYHRRRIRDEVESLRFAVRASELTGLGGIKCSSPPKDFFSQESPVEDYEITKETYLHILNSADLVQIALSNYEELYYLVFIYKYDLEYTENQIFSEFYSGNYEFKTSLRTIQRVIKFNREYAQIIISSNITQNSLISMMRRFGVSDKKRFKNKS
jgi:hypothetical protein